MAEKPIATEVMYFTLSSSEVNVLDEALTAFMRLQERCREKTTCPWQYETRYRLADSLRTRFLKLKEGDK